MKVSYRWLRLLAPELEAGPREVAGRLAALGFPVEEIEELGRGLGDLRVGLVREVRAHPDADRLVLCDVDDGEAVVQVVCGAPNVEAGRYYPFAPVGATLPGGLTIRKAKLRGQASHGMLCSEAELGLGRDAGGLMELEGNHSAGHPLVDALGLDDVRLDVEVTSNRPDLLSHRGVAREIAPGGDAGVRLPPIPGEDPDVARRAGSVQVIAHEREATGGGVTIRIEAPELCGAYLGLVVRGVRVGPSPEWLQTRLRAAGARPINNVVDATNYVLLETGQPLHAFDLARLEEHTIVVRTAREAETIRTLDGEERRLDPEMLAICDVRRPVAIAGVMGGEESEVGAGTHDILLECALFTPPSIRRTRKELGMSTDASYRFERGVDPEGLREAVLRTARLILATAGGTLDEPLLEVRPAPFERATVALRPARVEKVLGVPFTEERIRELLTPLGFRFDAPGAPLQVQVPGFRSWDVRREVDLIEEIARTHGYDAFPDELAPFRPGTVPEDPLFLLEDRLRRELAARGLLEAHTLAFASEDRGEVEILNPISREERFLRKSLLPGLLDRVAYNLARGNRDVRLFELGTVFARGAAGALPRETTHLAVALHGRRHPPHWSLTDEPLDMWDLKGLLVDAVSALGEEGWRVEPGFPPGGPGPSAPAAPEAGLVVLDAGGALCGWGGRIDPVAVDRPPWAGEVWGLELALPSRPMPPREIVYEELPQHPGVERDLSLLVDRDRPVAVVLQLIRREGGGHLREVEVFDLWEGEGIPAGKRSVAVRLRFRAQDRTLEDAEVDERMDHLIATLGEELGVGVRGYDG